MVLFSLIFSRLSSRQPYNVPQIISKYSDVKLKKNLISHFNLNHSKMTGLSCIPPEFRLLLKENSVSTQQFYLSLTVDNLNAVPQILSEHSDVILKKYNHLKSPTLTSC